MKGPLSGFIVFLLVACSHSQTEPVEKSMPTNWPAALKGLEIDTAIALNPDYRFQMVYTSIQDGQLGETISYGTGEYFYPASLIKIPTAMVALEKMEEWGIGLDDYIVFDTVDACGSLTFVELSRKKHVTFRQMFTEMLVVSDNHFYNSLYHFVTPKELNKRLNEIGATETHIYRAFTGCNKVDQLHTYPYKVFKSDGTLNYGSEVPRLDSTVLDKAYTHSADRILGSAHENSDGDIVSGGFDLNFMPEFPVKDIHKVLTMIFFPESIEPNLRWKVSEKNRLFICDLMQKRPSEITSVHRNLSKFDDQIYKYAVPQSKSNVPMRTYSKLGLSYGFASEMVYVKFPNSNNGFLLSYSIYVNENDTVNDGVYEYEEVARVFAQKLADAFMKFQDSASK